MTDIDQLALDIQRALQYRDATSDRRNMPDMHTTIVRVIREFVEEHELETTRMRNAWDIERAALKHRIKELNEQLDEHAREHQRRCMESTLAKCDAAVNGLKKLGDVLEHRITELEAR